MIGKITASPKDELLKLANLNPGQVLAVVNDNGKLQLAISYADIAGALLMLHFLKINLEKLIDKQLVPNGK